jgi:pimeloyl-ACP methyl ester carboxylesterase
MSVIQAVRLSSSYDPEQRGEVAFRHFCTPRLSSYRSPDHELLAERARFHLRNAASARVTTSEGDIQAYVFEPEPSAATGASVLLVHGWTAEASFMTAFAEHFRKRGLRAVLFDLPAHGKSAGERTSLIACAHVVRQIAEALGPIQYVVGHSLGGLAALLAGGGGAPMPCAYPFLDYVLVAVPNRFAEVTRKFGSELGLSPAAQRAYERRLEGIAHRAIADFTAVSLLAATGRPALVVHARDDIDVAFADAEEIAASSRAVRLQLCDGLGHRKILYAPPVVRSAAAYLLRQRESVTARAQLAAVS